jgi:hypothetical protein
MATRKLMLVLYTVGTVVMASFSISYFAGNSHEPFQPGLTHAAWSCVPIVALLLTALFVRQRSSIVLWLLLLVVIGAAVSLFFAMIYHLFPARALLASAIHVAIVLSGVPVIARALVPQKQDHGAL